MLTISLRSKMWMSVSVEITTVMREPPARTLRGASHVHAMMALLVMVLHAQVSSVYNYNYKHLQYD